MNEFFTKQNAKLFISLLLILFISCDKTPTQSVFVENPTTKPDPVISSIEPPNGALAGIGQITIKGSNFSSKIEENAVFVGPKAATILSASASELVIQSPNTIADSLEIKVSVIGALLFSNVVHYNLESALQKYSTIGFTEVMHGITVDKDENLYVSVSRDGSTIARRIDRVLPDESIEKGWGSTSFLSASHMRIGPGSTLYLARNTSSLYTIGSGGGSSSSLTSLSGSVYDLDFNSDGSMYAAGNGDNLYLVQTNGNFESVADYASTYVKGVRVFNGYVYVAGTESGSTEAVWRNQINSPNSLGPKELVIDLTAELGFATEIEAITFAEDGDMYLSIINSDDPILIVHPDGSFEPLYPGVLKPADAVNIEVTDMAWGNGVYLYINLLTQFEEPDGSITTVREMYKVNMQKNGAVYYGRDM
jgi:hypothetical protein